MDWFRSWHGAPTDNKWLVIARKANVAPGVVSAIAWALFDYASQAQDRGSVIDFDAETYAAFSGWSEEQIDAVIVAMRVKGVITPDNRLSAWEKRQPKREDDSTPRVQAFRERSNAMKRGVTQGNAPEQIQSRADTEQIRVEQNAAAAVKAYENTIGLISGAQQREEIVTAIDELSAIGHPEWWNTALKEAADHNARSWAYVRRIVERCLSTGQSPGTKLQRSKGNGRASEPTSFGIASEANAIANRARDIDPATGQPYDYAALAAQWDREHKAEDTTSG